MTPAICLPVFPEYSFLDIHLWKVLDVKTKVQIASLMKSTAVEADLPLSDMCRVAQCLFVLGFCLESLGAAPKMLRQAL